jgi:hypothetical protein
MLPNLMTSSRRPSSLDYIQAQVTNVQIRHPQSRLLRLRLASRALIEWKTPATAEQYQLVLRDLLAIHPYASSWGLKLDSQILKQDPQGTVLWYLSETLDSQENPMLLYPQGKSRRILRIDLEERILHEAKQALILLSNGHAREADIIIDAVHSKERNIRDKGYAALIAFAVPLNIYKQNEVILDLINHVKPVSQVMQNITKTVETVFRIIRFLLASIVLLAFLAIIIGAFILLLAASRSQTTSDNIIWAIVILSSLSSLLALQRQNVANLFTAISWGSRSRQFLAKFLLGRVESRQNWGQKTIFIDPTLRPQVFNYIGQLCGRDGDVMIALLQSSQRTPWAEAALVATTSVMSPVIQQTLHLVRSADLNKQLRDSVVAWLCHMTSQDGSTFRIPSTKEPD